MMDKPRTHFISGPLVGGAYSMVISGGDNVLTARNLHHVIQHLSLYYSFLVEDETASPASPSKQEG